ILHGGPGFTQGYLLPQMTQLADNHFCIFYDQRACGASTGEITDSTMQIDPFVADIEAIRAHFGYKKMTVIGHSWGGFLAMHYALQHPEAVTNLVLLNSCPASSDEYALFIQEWSRRMQPYMQELAAIKETAQFQAGDPDTVELYYRLLLRT